MAEEHSRVPREEWRKRVERWRDSGLTAAEFAGELGINPRTLMYWKWLLARDDKASTPALERRQSPKQARVEAGPAGCRGAGGWGSRRLDRDPVRASGRAVRLASWARWGSSESARAPVVQRCAAAGIPESPLH
ncbi:IS66 family insertion sequence element accessory protein TnpA [Sorangium sp. So ce124]|uniref:IS66 family insertion sequence element accessory protein TnpA n=1 Tax=Sorangium sp. So ce124 TaxID=3133280 RepID=UPI003F610ED0